MFLRKGVRPVEWALHRIAAAVPALSRDANLYRRRKTRDKRVRNPLTKPAFGIRQTRKITPTKLKPIRTINSPRVRKENTSFR